MLNTDINTCQYIHSCMFAVYWFLLAAMFEYRQLNFDTQLCEFLYADDCALHIYHSPHVRVVFKVVFPSRTGVFGKPYQCSQLTSESLNSSLL